MLEGIASHLRFAYRSFGRTPGASLLAVTTLALGIAANVAMFSVANTILLRPLPFKAPGELVWLTQTDPSRGLDSRPVPWEDYLAWRDRSTSFESLAAFQDGVFYLSRHELADKVSGAEVTPSLFPLLGVDAQLGRTFRHDGAQGADNVVVLGHGLWQRAFSAKEGVVGTTIRVDGRERVVIGVMPPHFQFPEYAELWVPLSVERASRGGGSSRLAVVGRLADGASLAQARDELQSVMHQLAEERPHEARGVGVSLVRLRKHYVGPTGVASLVFLTVAAGLLLVVCANLAGFLLARAVARQKEMAVRSSLGASRGQILRQLLIESVALATVGGAAGLLLGAWGLRLLIRSIPVELPFWAVFSIDWRVVGFTLAATFGAGLLFGIAPASYAFRFDLNSLLKSGHQRGGRKQQRLFRLLVAGQLALAFAFFLLAASMGGSFLALQMKDTGLRTPEALAVEVDLWQLRDRPDRHREVQRRLVQDLESLPGVSQVALTSVPPLLPMPSRSVVAAGRQSKEDEQVARVRVVSPAYTEMLGIRMMALRLLRPGDRRDTALVNRQLVARLWGGDEAVGRRLRVGEDRWVVVVGVVEDVIQDPLEDRVLPEVYLPAAATPLSTAWVLVSTATEPWSLADPVRIRISEIGSELVVERLTTLDTVMQRALWQPRIYSWLLGLLAVAVLTVAVLGLYGLVAYSVGQRRHEFAVRMALGADRSRIRRLVLRQAAILTVIGVALGVAISLGLGRVLVGALSWFDPAGLVFTTLIVLLFAAVTVLAGWGPSRKASCTSPASILQLS